MKQIFKLQNADKKSYITALAILFTILVDLGIFAYYFYYKKIDEESSSLEPSLRDKDNFTLSNALAGANKEGVITFTIILFFLILYLHYLRKNKLILILGSLFVIIILSIIISLLYITPLDEIHTDLAAVGFVFTFLYNILVSTIIYYNYKNLFLFLSLLIPNIIITLILVIVVSVPSISEYIIKNNEKDLKFYDDLFASAELLIIFLFICSLMILGFYKKLKSKRI